MATEEKGKKDLPKGFDNVIDWAVQWLGVPALVYAAYKTDALKTAKTELEGIYRQGKTTFERNQTAYKIAMIKPLTIALLVSAGVLLALNAILFAATSFWGKPEEYVVTGCFTVNALMVALLIIKAGKSQPYPAFKKTGKHSYERYPETMEFEGVTMPHPQRGMRIITNLDDIDQSKVSLLWTVAFIAIAGAVTSVTFITIGAFTHSVIPVIIGFALLMAIRLGTRVIVGTISKIIEKSGDFLEWALGKFKIHLAVLEAGVTYENVERGDAEIFDQRFVWRYYQAMETPFILAIIALSYPNVLIPTPTTFVVTGILIVLTWMAGTAYMVVGKKEEVLAQRTAFAGTLHKHAWKVAIVLVPLAALFPNQIQAVRNWVGSLNSHSYCDFLLTTEIYTGLLIGIAFGAAAWFFWWLFGKERKQKDGALHKGLMIGWGVAGLALSLVSAKFVFASILSMNPQFCHASVSLVAVKAQNETPKGVSSAEPAKPVEPQVLVLGKTEQKAEAAKEQEEEPEEKTAKRETLEEENKRLKAELEASKTIDRKVVLQQPPQPAPTETVATPRRITTVRATDATPADSSCEDCTPAFARYMAARERRRKSQSQ